MTSSVAFPKTKLEIIGLNFSVFYYSDVYLELTENLRQTINFLHYFLQITAIFCTMLNFLVTA